MIFVHVSSSLHSVTPFCNNVLGFRDQCRQRSPLIMKIVICCTAMNYHDAM